MRINPQHDNITRLSTFLVRGAACHATVAMVVESNSAAAILTLTLPSSRGGDKHVELPIVSRFAVGDDQSKIGDTRTHQTWLID